MICKSCKKDKSPKKFWNREDRNGKYAFCIKCCISQKRDKNWPSSKKRGGGLRFVHLDETARI